MTTLVQDVLLCRGGAERVFVDLKSLVGLDQIIVGLLSTNVEDPVRDCDCVLVALLREEDMRLDDHLALLERLIRASLRMKVVPGATLISHHHTGLLFRTDLTRTAIYLHTPTRFLWEPERVPWEVNVLSDYQDLLRRYEVRAVQSARFVFANSSYTAARVAACYGRVPEVIYPSVTLWQRVALCEPGDIVKVLAGGRYLLTVSRLVPGKGLEELFEYVADLELTLVVVGNGRSAKEFKSTSPSNVVFAGHRSDAEIRWLLRHASAYVSCCVEDFGLAVAEALCEGTPCLVPDEGGSAEILDSWLGVTFELTDGKMSFLKALDLVLALPRFSGGVVDAMRKRWSKQSFVHPLQSALDCSS